MNRCEPTIEQRILGLRNVWAVLIEEVIADRLMMDDVTPIVDVLSASIDDLRTQAGDAPV
jgi:hypothetical protein